MAQVDLYIYSKINFHISRSRFFPIKYKITLAVSIIIVIIGSCMNVYVCVCKCVCIYESGMWYVRIWTIISNFWKEFDKKWYILTLKFKFFYDSRKNTGFSKTNVRWRQPTLCLFIQYLPLCLVWYLHFTCKKLFITHGSSIP